MHPKLTSRQGKFFITQSILLLAGRNFDAQGLQKSLQALSIKTSYEPLEAIADTDIEAFLNHHHEMVIVTAIEEAKKEVDNVLTARLPKISTVNLMNLFTESGKRRRKKISPFPRQALSPSATEVQARSPQLELTPVLTN